MGAFQNDKRISLTTPTTLTTNQPVKGRTQMAYDNTNRGVLFKNTDKENPKHADYNGNLNVDGQEFWLNAWIKESKAGVKFLSVSVKPKKERGTTKSGAGMDMDDQIPFAPEWRA
jgi:hypothetical protein